MKVITLRFLIPQYKWDILEDLGYAEEQFVDELRYVAKQHAEEMIEQFLEVDMINDADKKRDKEPEGKGIKIKNL